MGKSWYHTFDDQFWIMLGGMLLAFLGIIAKSKCSRITCCGIEIERDVRAELAAERFVAQQRAGIQLPTHTRQSSMGDLLNPHNFTPLRGSDVGVVEGPSSSANV